MLWILINLFINLLIIANTTIKSEIKVKNKGLKIYKTII